MPFTSTNGFAGGIQYADVVGREHVIASVD
jgi:hypothetical protein